MHLHVVMHVVVDVLPVAETNGVIIDLGTVYWLITQ